MSDTPKPPQWMVQNTDGKTLGPYDFGDIENYLIQGRMTIESLISHPAKTQGKWVVVSRVPKLVALVSKHLEHKAAINQLNRSAIAPVKKEFSREAIVTILISAISNIVFGLFWCGIIIGFPIGLAMFVLSYYEFSAYGKRKTYDLIEYRKVTFQLGVAEIILGLFNGISLVCGIITLLNRPPEPE